MKGEWGLRGSVDDGGGCGQAGDDAEVVHSEGCLSDVAVRRSGGDGVTGLSRSRWMREALVVGPV